MNLQTFSSLSTIEEITIATQLLEHLASHDMFRDKWRTTGKAGGYIRKVRGDGVPLLHVPIGTFDLQKVGRYSENATRKCDALLAARKSVMSSMQIRREEGDAPIYGGGVRCRLSLRSISGLDEEEDELFSALWGFLAHDLLQDNLEEVLERNSLFPIYRMNPHGFWK